MKQFIFALLILFIAVNCYATDQTGDTRAKPVVACGLTEDSIVIPILVDEDGKQVVNFPEDLSINNSLTVGQTIRVGNTAGKAAYNAIDDDSTLQASALMNAKNDFFVEGDVEIAGALSSSKYLTVSGGGAYISGNVGIGTINPSYKLDIQGTGNIRQQFKSTSGGQARLDLYGNRDFALISGNGFPDALYVYDQTANKTPFTIEAATLDNTLYLKSTGNVGIGTTSPLAKLSVAGTSDQVQNRVLANATQTSDILQILDDDATTEKLDFTDDCKLSIYHTSATNPSSSVSGALYLTNTATSTGSSDIKYPPPLILKGSGWTGSAAQITEHMIASSPMNNGNPTLRFYVREGGTGAWTEIWNADQTGQHEFTETWIDYDARETFSLYAQYANSAPATESYDQYSYGQRFFGTGWKTNATAASQSMSLQYAVTPEQGAANPIGVFKYMYGTNTTTPSESNELLRYEWGDRLGTVFNEQSLNGYNFRVESDSDENAFVVSGTTNNVGIGTVSPSAKLGVKGDLSATGTLTTSGTIFVGSLPTGSTEPAEVKAGQLWVDSDDGTIKIGT